VSSRSVWGELTIRLRRVHDQVKFGSRSRYGQVRVSSRSGRGKLTVRSRSGQPDCSYGCIKKYHRSLPEDEYLDVRNVSKTL